MKHNQLLVTLCCLALPMTGWAQGRISSTRTTERLRIQQVEQTRAFDPKNFLGADKSDSNVEAGGWGTFIYLNLRDEDRDPTALDSAHGLWVQDYRLWLQAKLSSEFSTYIRVRTQTINYQTQPGESVIDTRSQERPQLDLGFVEYTPTQHVRLRAGRQFLTVGRGFVLAQDLDGAEMDHMVPGWEYRLFAANNLKRDPNIDTSVTGYDLRTQDRTFYGSEVSHNTLKGTHYYGYFLVQQDASRSNDPDQAARNFHYNSNYLGLGTDGAINPRLTYYFEGVREGGSSLADALNDPNPQDRVRIEAYSALAGLLYYPKGDWHPLVTLEYGFGSGDASRNSVTDTFRSKLQATTDTNFLYFGVYDGGLALSPRLSNLNVIRAGYQVKPLPRGEEDLPQLLVGTKVSYYWKDEANGFISDSVASEQRLDVGAGLDVFVATRPLSDTSIFLQYGRFFPGAAYPAATDSVGDRFLATTTIGF
jgi:hypothetical protein